MEEGKILKKILEVALDAVIQISANGIIKFWNTQAEKTFGWTSDEAIGQIVSDLIIPEKFRQSHIDGMKRYLDTGIASVLNTRIEVPGIRKSGEEFPLELSITPIETVDGLEFSAFVRDITEQKKNKLELKQKKEYLANIIETTPACIKTVSESGELLSMNSAGLNMIEVNNANSAIGESVYKLVTEEYREKFIQFNKNICNGSSESLEFQIVGLKGTKRWMESYGVPLTMEDGSISQLAITHDISERKKTELLLESQKEKLINNTKMAALGEMASGIAHEINNPLTIISGSAMIVRKIIEDKDFDLKVLEKSMCKIENTAQRISKIIDGLKSISRNADNDPMDKVNIKNVISETLTLSQEKFKNEKNKLIVDYDDSDIFVLGRKSQLTQVLLNLLNNSIDALEKSTEKWTKIHVYKKDLNINVAVTDSGSGISEDVLLKLMQPFFTTKAVGKGTGLGLSISKGIIESHKGRFYYDKNCDNTRFVISIPFIN